MTQEKPIPELPETVSALVRLCFDDKATAAELVRLMAAIPELAALFQTIARSGYFGGGFCVGSPVQAVVRTGFPFARKWAAVSALSNLMRSGGHSLGTSDFWRRALCRAVVADSLEDYFTARPPSEACVVGFLWESGCFFAPQGCSGGTAARLSAQAMRVWGVPERCLADFAPAHSRPPTPDDPPLWRFCHVADTFARLCFGSEQDIHAFLLDAQQLLGVPETEVEDLVIGSLGTLYGISEKLVATDDVRQGLRDLIAKASHTFRDLFARVAKEAPENLPTLETLDVAAARPALEAMAHELRNPLMVVGGFARRLAAALDSSSKEHEYAQIILEQGRRLEDLFRDMEAAG
ncbi:Metal-dependent hydrolase HDOD [Desulfovibrio sp. X2]|uniref:HDOD domain-containing protein n=1 Tax=Desulfovibrio sp. X2 TaxID=941449 RepID=UPI000358F2E5|nr:HDOD domain-containing protein [Desulfovibrio sp. X2]EPR41918.1 Metal-dependent hydrolase HDOD [Desulfovibrio sp. X2]